MRERERERREERSRGEGEGLRRTRRGRREMSGVDEGVEFQWPLRAKRERTEDGGSERVGEFTTERVVCE